jgi:hypothetical protein
MTDREQIEMEAAMTRALEQPPTVAIPQGFAARVARSLPAAPVARRPVYAGRTVASIAAVVLLVAVFVVAPHSQPSFANVAFDLEILLIAQVGGIAYWLAGKRAV